MNIETKIAQFMRLATENGSSQFSYFCSLKSFDLYFSLINASDQNQVYAIYIKLSNEFYNSYIDENDYYNFARNHDVFNFLNISLIFYKRLFEYDDYNFLIYCFNFFECQDEEEDFIDLRGVEILVQELRKEYNKKRKSNF